MEASGWAYTEALSELYPTRADVAAEIAELEGRLTLPRSNELFASDIHGAYNAFSHVLRGGSGAVRALIEDVFGSTLNDDEKAALLALAFGARGSRRRMACRSRRAPGQNRSSGRRRPHHRRSARASA